MDYRQRKQLFIIISYFLFFSLIIFLVYYIWFRHIPTCNDGIKNQRETEIDCGGPCSSCEIKTLKDVNIVWVKAFPIKQGIYDLAAYIDNLNPNYGSGNLSYEFFLYDASDNVIISKKGVTFILPGKPAYVIEPYITTQQSVSRVKLVLSQPKWEKLEGFEQDLFFIKDKKYSLLDKSVGYSQVSGIVKNNSSFDFDRVNVDVIILNSQNQPIGVNKTEIRTLVAGEERYFTSQWFTEIKGDVVSEEVMAETNAFQNTNFMKRFGTPEKFKGID